MQLKIIFCALFALRSVLGFGQLPDLTPLSKISVLTCGPGEELSSTFGHTAIRIQDPTLNLDIVMGYGGFDFDDPNFYWKFTTGKLDYTMTAHRFSSFLEGYKQENRWVSEQELHLSTNSKNAIFNALKENYSIENWGYKYDFLFDNCATRIPDIFKNALGEKVEYDFTHLESNATFRQLIHENLTWNAWDTFGIDLALGAVIDRKATPWEHQFLPIYVSDQLAHTSLDKRPIANEKTILFKALPGRDKSLFILSPLFFAIVLLALVAFKTYTDYKKNKRTKWLDFGLFFLSGAAGLLISFLWFVTDHASTKLNFNILWAFPLNLLIAFMLLKARPVKQWLLNYLWVLLAFLAITMLLWLFKLQIFSPLIIFLMLALGFRYLFLLHYFKHEIDNS